MTRLFTRLFTRLTNEIGELYQSAYKSNHNTETALIRVHNDIAMAIDQRNSAILVLFDVSAAFDTVDHGLLLSRLSNRFGIAGTVLEWFRSYLSDPTQFVQVNDACSASHVLESGVPQGSVLGPLLYSLYKSPLGEIARQHQMLYHFYADDTKLYITFRTSSVSDMNLSNTKSVNCVRDVDAWMLSNNLKLNKDKSEVLVISSSHRPRPPLSSAEISNETAQKVQAQKVH
ncbi:putative RNA-directed DNA polymerase from transposon BS [Stylophora pistillata]|uniref:Putative RNA-directed DNA polymerase from transposon BS n=1 Tax=Stylophora pistillata TaxID=50429 RepID=A0A2B4SD43_STYPI|nr:putative RNA-directed DNA polymerase from transposon BS [Stylophora pistillata]